MSASPVFVVSGATGLVGSQLVGSLLATGSRVRALTRSPERARSTCSLPEAEDPEQLGFVEWDGHSPLPSDLLSGCAGAVHLAGEPIFSGRLTRTRRERILASRVDSTNALVASLGALPAGERPRTFVCASAVGIYGDRGDERLDEQSPVADADSSFLASVCRAWETAAGGAREFGVPSVSLRIGVVLSREGGALALMLPLFRAGLGGRLGSGRQWFPWVHVSDLVSIVRFALERRLDGAVNASAPNPLRNAEFTRALARGLRRPAFLPAPAFALRAALGELSGELLGSRRVVPAALEAAGFRFAHPHIESALATELSA